MLVGIPGIWEREERVGSVGRCLVQSGAVY